MTIPATSPRRLVRLAFGAALGTLLAGCSGTGSSGLAQLGALPQAAPATADQQVPAAEQAVLDSPADAAARVALGRAYLRAGRFASAAQAFDDALELGDESPQTALSIALAEAGQGHQADAIRILDEWRDVITGQDLGLAYALSGDPARGAAILADVLRGGTNTAKVRQNLAYAYALNGRWREAQVMMAQDVPANQVNDRLMQWAQSARPGAHHQRVAQLLGAPVRADGGLPPALALRAGDAAVAVSMPLEAPVTAPVGAHLPVIDPVALAPVTAPLPDSPVPARRPLPFASPRVPEPVAQPDQPVVRQAQPGDIPPEAEFVGRKPAPRPGKVAPIAAARAGTYLVQLGSFTDLAQADAAWATVAARNPTLKSYRPITTTARVNGQAYYRVSAVGFASRDAAAGACRQVKARGGPCLVVSGNSEVARAPIVTRDRIALALR